MAVQTHQPKPPSGLSRLLFRLPMHTPDVTIQVGRRTLSVHARRLSSEEAADEMADYARRNPKAARALAGFMGFEVDGTETGYRELGAQLPFVALKKREA